MSNYDKDIGNSFSDVIIGLNAEETCLHADDASSTISVQSNDEYFINDVNLFTDVNLQDFNICEDTYDILIDTLAQTRSDNPKSLIIGHVNINSLKKEEKLPIEYFKDILNKKLIDILCISESKLDSAITDKDLDCAPIYRCHRKDKESMSGGLCVWIRSDIPQHRMLHLEFSFNTYHIESMVFELKVKKEIWSLILAYKNPSVANSMFIPKLSSIYDKIISKSKEIILLGDLNIDMLVNTNDLQNDLCDIYDLTNIVKEPTCFKKPDGTLIDPIIVRNSRRFKKPINVKCGLSDHHNLVACITKVNVPHKVPKKITYRSLKTFNEDDFKKEVSNIPFHVGDIFTDESDKYWFKRELFSDVLNEHAPIKQRAIKDNFVPYMNSALRKEIYKRNMLRNIYKKDPRNNAKWERFRAQRNKVVSMRRDAIRGHFDNLSEKDDNKKSFWEAISPFLSEKSKSQNNIILKEENDVITDTKEICEIFACFFSSIANSIGVPDEIDMSTPTFLADIFNKHSNHESILRIKAHHSNVDIPFTFKPVHPDYVKNILSKLNANKSTGCDNIPPKVVKLCADELCGPMTDMINSAIRNNVFPDDMKKADLAPLFKKLDDMLKENYRPVSILPVFSKVFEIVIADQLKEYFKNIFNKLLCAYRKRYGCNHVVIKLIEEWKAALDINLFAGTILMDLSKAFDCMPHGLLIAKLKAYGLSDDACTFICSYLCERFQRVKIADERSTWTPLSKGVPQGSCLGPLLFNIFMNDIFYFIETCLLVNYADDNTLSKVESTIELLMSALKRDTEISIHWFKINLMQANADKFQLMLLKSFNSKAELPEFITINDTRIKAEDYVKLLGIIVDNDLKFDKHIDMLCKNASRQINVMYRFKGIFGFKQREDIHNTFILANFNYCPIVWHFCSKSSTRKIEKIQERALRFLFNDKVSSYECLLEKCKSTTLHLRRIKTIALEVFRSLNDLNPPFMKEFFTPKNVEYDLRDGNILIQPKFQKVTYGKNSLRYYGAHIWNLLPPEVKKTTTLDHFKALLEEWDGPKCQCAMCKMI